MLRFVRTMSKSVAAQMVEGWLSEYFSNTEGVCYYKHPAVVTKAVATNTDEIPDFILFTKTNQPLVVRIVKSQLSEIKTIEEDTWEINDTIVDSPLLVLEDLFVKLENKFQDQRKLRNRLHTQAVLVLPFITKSDFEARFGALSGIVRIIWKSGDISAFQRPLERGLSDEEWTLTRSVIQGSTHLHKPSPVITQNSATLGSAIRELDKHIAALDDEQEKVALEIAPGPQRIRGLAGTGKTVLLAMKAAHIHMLYPDKKILFTFNTWSLYDQVNDLITKKYHAHKGTYPDWNFLHVRHACGGLIHSGVYLDLCARQWTRPLDLRTAENSAKQKEPLQLYCEHAFQRPIEPEYDFILIDEAQDFPKEFFHVLFKLAEEPKRIYWASDELQNLSSLEIPKPEELFGVDEQGRPHVSLEGNPYEGPIEKDIVLHRAYKCPLEILMLAHAIGLGIHNSDDGPVRMLEDQADWEAIGYEVEYGKLQRDEQVVIVRNVENSSNPILKLYDKQPPITVNVFSQRETELDWIANSIKKDLQAESIAPQQILVIALSTKEAEQHLAGIQLRLFQEDIASTIPGLIEEASAVQEGKVTLSTVSRVKGDEAYIVYILGADALYDYTEEFGTRNRAFASITRSKAWVRITGTGKRMEAAKDEINKILADLPRFKFSFPDMKKVRDAESNYKHRQVLEVAEQAVVDLNKTAIKALVALMEKRPGTLEALSKHINEALNEY